MCLFTNSSEQCDHPECNRPPFQNSQISNSSLIGNLSLLIQQQSLALSDLMNKNALLNSKLDFMQDKLKLNPKQSQNDLLINNDEIFRLITSDHSFEFYVKLKNEFPDAIYKERGFALEAFVSNEKGEKAEQFRDLIFNVKLFTAENPPKALKKNISGKKILRGTVETSCNLGEVVFSNIVINEVTSHYPNNKFCFVVMCSNSQEIKPLVLPNVMVRARKHKQ